MRARRMKWSRLLVGVAVGAVGAVWFAQGQGSLHGSFMTGQRFWAVVGAPMFVAGVYLVVTSVPRGRGRGGDARDA
jgi:hypothetical protein